MFRPASRLIARSTGMRTFPHPASSRRFLSTAPPSQKSRSWKSLAGRVGILGAVIYFYNTTDVFSEEPRHAVHQPPETSEELEQLPTIEALAQKRQQRKAELAAAAAAAAENNDGKDISTTGDVQELEDEAGQQGAFNPETGEINWDCPCLGGMATGPCGEQFKAAFSCFVYSTEEPKGMDCVDKFKDMQNCFREYPEVYGSELEGDDDEDDKAGDDSDIGPLADAPELAQSETVPDSGRTEGSQKAQSKTVTEQRKKEQAVGGGGEAIPREVHDDQTASVEKQNN